MAAKRNGWRGAGRWVAVLVAPGLALAACAPEIGVERPRAEVDAPGGATADGAASSPVRRVPVAPDASAGAGGARAEESEVAFTMVSVRPGAEFEIELIDPILTGEHRPGDRFRAGVVRPLIENNMVLVPLNSLVEGEITAVERVYGGGDVLVKIRFASVFFNGRSWPMSASVVAIGATGPHALGPGSGAAPILGRVLGGGRQGAVAGAAAVATPGTAILLPAGEDAGAAPRLRAGAVLRLRLDAPLVFGIPAV